MQLRSPDDPKEVRFVGVLGDLSFEPLLSTVTAADVENSREFWYADTSGKPTLPCVTAMVVTETKRQV